MENTIITCPYCGHKQTVEVFTDRCLPFYKCNSCQKIVQAKEGSCCVICDFGDEKCPVSVK